MTDAAPPKKRHLDVYPPEDTLRAVDQWRREQDPIPSRAEAGRLLLDEILMTKGFLKRVAVGEAAA